MTTKVGGTRGGGWVGDDSEGKRGEEEEPICDFYRQILSRNIYQLICDHS